MDMKRARDRENDDFIGKHWGSSGNQSLAGLVVSAVGGLLPYTCCARWGFMAEIGNRKGKQV
jgi:hypothetical protein